MNVSRKGTQGFVEFLVFCFPTLLVFTTVVLLPFVFGLFLTFTNWDGISQSYVMAGFSNYASMMKDASFWASFGMTVKYVLAVVALTNLVAFSLAYLLTGGVRGQNFLRAGFFTPNLVGGIVLGLIWTFVFSNVFTWIGARFGIDAMSVSMLSKTATAFWALVLVAVWQFSGYMMVIYIAGFMNMPKDVLESASLDGVAGMKRFTSIIMPLMAPSFIICIFLTTQRAFMTYDVNLALKNGGPFKSTQLISMHVYNKAFLDQKFGEGQSEAFFLFLMVALATVTQIWFSKKAEVEA